MKYNFNNAVNESELKNVHGGKARRLLPPRRPTIQKVTESPKF